MTQTHRTLAIVCFVTLTTSANGDQGSLANSGGTATGGAGVLITSNVVLPAGTLYVNCPAVGAGGCTGGSLTFSGGTTNISAVFAAGTATESCYGGGKGGHITCGYSLTAYFTGTLSVGGTLQAIVGVTNQTFTVGGPASGATAYNSAYTPFYYSDSEQILRADDLLGTNQISFGSQGSGVGQFYGAYGIALDSAGRIYVADTYNSRIVRMDDMTGANWITFDASLSSCVTALSNPSGIAVDSKGRIYVMDTGNSRLIRIDDITGAGCVSFGTVGSGDKQFASFNSVAVDAVSSVGGSPRIYVADTGNKRLVRMDDMMGNGWTVLTQSPPVNGVSYSFDSPVAVAVGSNGAIYVADSGPAVIRVDDMTGTNWTSIYTSPAGSTGLNSISVDPAGTVFTGGGGVRLIDGMAGVLTSSGTIAPYGTYYVFGVTPIPLGIPRPSAIRISPTTLAFSSNVGTTSASQPVTISNFGLNPLTFSTSIVTSGGFSQTNNCPMSLAAGSSCIVNVSFTPSVTVPANGTLTVSDDSGNAGKTQTIALSGVGTAPSASVTPGAIAFSTQVEGTTSAAVGVIVQNTGTGPMSVSSVVVSPPFSQTNNCTGSIAPSASCTIMVSFTPTSIGPAAGPLTISDDAGTQTVSLTGNGGAPVSLSVSSLNFGTVVAGNTSSAKTVTLFNHEKTALNISGILASSGFTVATNTCGASIAAGASCVVGVTFSPTAVAAATGTLKFSDNALNTPQTVSLAGTGSAPVTFSTSTLSFGTVTVGTTSSAKTVTLTNHMSTALSVSLAASAGFAVVSNTCPTKLTSGASCTVGVTFSPTSKTSVTGKLTFTDNALTTPQLVTLTGTGK